VELSLQSCIVSSTIEEWKERAEVYLENRNYPVALYCFNRACDEDRVAVCKAYILLQEAEELWRTPSEQAKSQTRKAFIQAAEAFNNLASKFRRLKRTAADCFVKGGSHFKAAECYALVGPHQKAVFHYWEAKAFDEAYKTFCKHRNDLATDFAEKYEGRLRNHYVRLGDFQ
jgi:tetratricopeptide (TPR) repeat protein